MERWPSVTYVRGQIYYFQNGYYEEMHGGGHRLVDGTRGSCILKYTFNMFTNLAPRVEVWKWPFLQEELRRIWNCLDLDHIQAHQTEWALFLTQLRRRMRVESSIRAEVNQWFHETQEGYISWANRSRGRKGKFGESHWLTYRIATGTKQAGPSRGSGATTRFSKRYGWKKLSRLEYTVPDVNAWPKRRGKGKRVAALCSGAELVAGKFGDRSCPERTWLELVRLENKWQVNNVNRWTSVALAAQLPYPYADLPICTCRGCKGYIESNVCSTLYIFWNHLYLTYSSKVLWWCTNTRV